MSPSAAGGDADGRGVAPDETPHWRVSLCGPTGSDYTGIVASAPIQSGRPARGEGRPRPPGFRAQLALLGVLSAVLSGCGQSPGTSDDPQDGALPQADAALDPPDATDPRDAADAADVEVSPSADASTIESCDPTLIPTPGVADGWGGMDLSEGRLVFAKSELSPPVSSDLFVFDLQTCALTRLTQDIWAIGVAVHADVVVWNDARGSFIDPNHCNDIYRSSLDSWQEEQLTNVAYCDLLPVTNGQEAAFIRLDLTPWVEQSHVVLLDLAGGIESTLASAPESDLGNVAICSHTLAWTRQPQVPLQGEELWLYDLASGDSTELVLAAPHELTIHGVSDDCLFMKQTPPGMNRPQDLVVYDFATGDATVAAHSEENYDFLFAKLGRHLAIWTTQAYSGLTTSRPSDLELYDPRTGIHRRLTTDVADWAPTVLDEPWLILAHRLIPNQWEYDHYVVNLESLGVLDASGYLLPGPPLLAPPL